MGKATVGTVKCSPQLLAPFGCLKSNRHVDEGSRKSGGFGSDHAEARGYSAARTASSDESGGGNGALTVAADAYGGATHIHRESIYEDALETLEDLEEAGRIADLCCDPAGPVLSRASSNRFWVGRRSTLMKSSVYVDAKMFLNSNDERDTAHGGDAAAAATDTAESLARYPPATCPLRHARKSVVLSDPQTLLLGRTLSAVGEKNQSHHAKQKGTSMAETRANRRRSSFFTRQILRHPKVRVETPGYPGELTEEELNSCLAFRKELKRRAASSIECGSGDGDEKGTGIVYEEMVRAFRSVEEEPYALCRFLRSRNFDVEAVFEMMENGVEVWKEAREDQFYPDGEKALDAGGGTGPIPMSVFLSQYPTFHHGVAKNGCQVSYFRAGAVDVDGIECLTSLDLLKKFAWHGMMSKLPQKVADAQRKNSNVVQSEVIAVFDLKGLSKSQLSSRTLNVLAEMNKVNVCFPEVLNSLVILNAPGFFPFFWRIIKSFLDARTASKISIFSDETKGLKWLDERVDRSERLCDYGGSGPTFNAVLAAQGRNCLSSFSAQISSRLQSNSSLSSSTLLPVGRRHLTELMSIAKNGRAKYEFTLRGGERLTQLRVYTRSAVGCNLSLLKLGKPESDEEPVAPPLMEDFCAVNNNAAPSQSETPLPTCVEVPIGDDGVEGPGTFRIVLVLLPTVKGLRAMGASLVQHFLLVAQVD